MKLSTSVIAALLGFGSLVRGRPQQAGQDSTHSDIFDSSGSEIVASSGGDTSASNNVPNTAELSPEDVDFIDANNPNNPAVQRSDNELLAENQVQINPTYSDDQTQSPNDQPFETASSDPVGVTVADALEQVQSGKATYVICEIYTFQDHNGLEVLKIASFDPAIAKNPSAKQPSSYCIEDMRHYDRGYLLYHTKKGLVPVFFAMNANEKVIAGLFVTVADFNDRHHLDPNIEIISHESDFQDFLKRIG